MKRLLAIGALAGASLVAPPTPATSAGVKPDCPAGALVVIPFGTAASCRFGGRNDLWITFPGSLRQDGGHWRATCNRMGGRLRWWMPIGNSPRQGEYVCRWANEGYAR